MGEKKILVLRHGATDWNAEFRFQGRTDICLNALGEMQAVSVRSRIMSWQPEAVLVSPLGRAVRTAEIVTGADKRDLCICDDLIEICFGEWEGRKLADLRGIKEYMQWMEYPFSIPVSGVEPSQEVSRRVRSVLGLVLSRSEERFLLVSHGGTLRALISEAMGIPLSVTWKYFALDNCSLSGLAYRNGKFTLKFFNDRIHCICAEKKMSYVPLPIEF